LKFVPRHSYTSENLYPDLQKPRHASLLTAVFRDPARNRRAFVVTAFNRSATFTVFYCRAVSCKAKCCNTMTVNAKQMDYLLKHAFLFLAKNLLFQNQDYPFESEFVTLLFNLNPHHYDYNQFNGIRLRKKTLLLFT
jgi:hypothetical protein